MLDNKPEDGGLKPRRVSFSIRLLDADARRVVAIAEAHEWSLTKTIQKLVVAALDAKLVK